MLSLYLVTAYYLWWEGKETGFVARAQCSSEFLVFNGVTYSKVYLGGALRKNIFIKNVDHHS